MYLRTNHNKRKKHKPIKVNSNGLSFSRQNSNGKRQNERKIFTHKKHTFWHYDSDSKIGFG